LQTRERKPTSVVEKALAVARRHPDFSAGRIRDYLSKEDRRAITCAEIEKLLRKK
jgi:hypothetical protein